MGRLRASEIGKLAAGRHSDGENSLSLLVKATGRRSWTQRLTVDGRRVDIGLGPWPLITLSEARATALENRRTAYRGGDPRRTRTQRSTAPTFRQCADRALAALRPKWKNPDQAAAKWTAALARYVFPVLADKPVDRIERADVLGILSPIWNTKHETARKVRINLRAVLAWAQAHGHTRENVAGEMIDAALPARRANGAKHHTALPYDQVGGALTVIESSGAGESVRCALRWAALTAARTGEVLGAKWDEIDVGAREWRVPGSRTKTGAEFRVPLSGPTLAIVERMRGSRGPSGCLFPSPVSGRSLSKNALRKALTDMGLDATVHGFRSSFRDWCSEQTDAPHAVCEMALGHTVGSAVERSYARSDLFEKRRALMDRWADYIA